MAAGSPPRHKDLLLGIDSAIHGPKRVAIIKVVGHAQERTSHARGNEFADMKAKAAAGYLPATSFLLSIQEEQELQQRPFSLQEWSKAQAHSPAEEQELWLKGGESLHPVGLNQELQPVNIWSTPRGQIVLPSRFLQTMVQEAHGPAHVGIDAMK